jgi:hypothetical protein
MKLEAWHIKLGQCSNGAWIMAKIAWHAQSQQWSTWHSKPIQCPMLHSVSLQWLGMHNHHNDQARNTMYTCAGKILDHIIPVNPINKSCGKGTITIATMTCTTARMTEINMPKAHLIRVSSAGMASTYTVLQYHYCAWYVIGTTARLMLQHPNSPVKLCKGFTTGFNGIKHFTHMP